LPLPMARKKGKRAKGNPGKPSKVSTRNRYDTKNLVLKVLGEGPTRGGLTTIETTRRVSELRGEQVPEDAVGAVLRGLVGEKVLKWRRVGHKKAYRLVVPATRLAPAAPAPTAPVPPTPESPEPPALPVPDLPPGAPETARIGPPDALDASALGKFPHKLAVGEILLLGVQDGHVVSATNVHGKLVVERHPIGKP